MCDKMVETMEGCKEFSLDEWIRDARAWVSTSPIWGGNTFAVNGVPAGIEGVDPKSLLHEMVDDINVASQSEAIAIRLAQSAAVPYGQILNNDEMEAIINELFSCSNVNYTPDGKAILCILPQGDIEHLLG